MANAIRSTRIFSPRSLAMPPFKRRRARFDRLVMLASGRCGVDQVVWTPPAGEA